MIYTFMYNVYLISTDDGCKIGFTKRKVEDRIKEFKTGNSNDFKIISVFKSEYGTKIEKILHNKYKTKKIKGEWFLLEKEDIDNFINECKKSHEILKILNDENTYINRKQIP